MEKIWNDILTFLKTNGWKIAAMFAAILIGFFVIKLICRALKKLFERRHIDSIVTNFILKVAYILMVIILIVAIFDIINVSTAPFVAVLGSAGLAFALSLQDSLSNIAGGILIIVSKPFKHDDYVKIGDVEGRVKKINMLNTVLFTFDNKTVIVPNNTIAKSNIINFSGIATRRLDIKFSVAYGSDIDKVKKVISELIEKDKRILSDPPYKIYLVEQAASALVFSIRLWVPTEKFWDIKFDTDEGVYRTLVASDIEIPYNKLDVNITSSDIKN